MSIWALLPCGHLECRLLTSLGQAHIQTCTETRAQLPTHKIVLKSSTSGCTALHQQATDVHKGQRRKDKHDQLRGGKKLHLVTLLHQVVMAVFAYLYFNNVVARQTVTVGYMLQKSLALDGSHMLELFTKLGALSGFRCPLVFWYRSDSLGVGFAARLPC